MGTPTKPSTPVTPDEMSDPDSPVHDESSEASTPLDPPSSSSDGIPGPPSASSMSFLPPNASDPSRRVPSLRTISDPQSLNPMSSSSSLSGALNNARRAAASVGGLPTDLMQKARALQQQRMGARPTMSSPPSSTGIPPFGSGSASPMGAVGGIPIPRAGGVPGNFQLPGGGRPVPPGFRSAPVVPSAKPSLSERRAMKLGGLPSGSPSPGGTPKLSDIQGPSGGTGQSSINGEGRGSKLSDFKKYIDTDKGWVTFEGAATITRDGVSFANGTAYSISLDEIEVLEELGKGNYGTVYKVRHARPRAPRFGQGLSGFRSQMSTGSSADGLSSEETSSTSGPATTGKIMAMKELRLELEEAKFTTILRELVILHQCTSPYVIDFYGAFFQEGAVYMCIEHMDAGSIDKLYAGGIPEPILRKITFSTVMGLHILKASHSIIHRDVKPTNILVNSKGQIKICDFGVSGNLVASKAKTNIGCQSYMAPERISTGGAAADASNTVESYSVSSDIWSLGLTIIECALGRYPYPPEVSTTIFSQLNAIVSGEPPTLPSEGYSPMAQDFVHQCLNKNASKRPKYEALLAHPWLSSLKRPETITEEAEAEEEAAGNELADATGRMTLNDQGDDEVADWVRAVFKRKGRSSTGEPAARPPALHAAPLGRGPLIASSGP